MGWGKLPTVRLSHSRLTSRRRNPIVFNLPVLTKIDRVSEKGTRAAQWDEATFHYLWALTQNEDETGVQITRRSLISLRRLCGPDACLLI